MLAAKFLMKFVVNVIPRIYQSIVAQPRGKSLQFICTCTRPARKFRKRKSTCLQSRLCSFRCFIRVRYCPMAYLGGSMQQDKDESVNPVQEEILFLFRHRRGSPYFFKRFFTQTLLFGSLILARFAYKYVVVLEYST